MSNSLITSPYIKHYDTKNHSIKNSLCDNLLGYGREYCISILSTKGIDTIAFGHWLAIPSRQLLLVFRHQCCIAIDDYQQTA